MNLRRFLPPAMVLMLLAQAALADFYRIPGMRVNDVFLTTEGLDQRLAGRVVEFQSGVRMHFYDNGKWMMEPREGVEGPTGSYSFGPKGQVCVRYDRGGGRCDSYVRSVKKVVMIDGGGGRHPVKSMVRE